MKKRPSATHETTRTFCLPSFLEIRMRRGMLLSVESSVITMIMRNSE